MKLRRLLLASSCLTLLVVTSSVATQAAQPNVRALSDAACRDVSVGTPLFDEAKRLCYESLSGLGQHQELINRIEVSDLGRTPQDRYFLGASYFALSLHAGSPGLRCKLANLASLNLDYYLTHARDLYDAQHTFGTRDDMKYTELAVKEHRLLERALSGCEDTPPLPDEITNEARRFTRARAEGMLLGSGTPDPLQQEVATQFASLTGQARDFVTTAASVEGNLATTRVELDGARDRLLQTEADIIKAFGAIVVRVPAQGLFDYQYDSVKLPTLLSSMANRATELRTHLTATTTPGTLAYIKAQVSAKIGSMPLIQFHTEREQRVKALGQLSSNLVAGANYWTASLEWRRASDGKNGIKDLDAESRSGPMGTIGIVQTASAVDTAFRCKMRSRCPSSAWFCNNPKPLICP
jgi:hypothetical protein